MTVIVTFSHLVCYIYMYFNVCGRTQYYYDIVLLYVYFVEYNITQSTIVQSE